VEDGSNLGWWVPALVIAFPLLLLLSLHLLGRLESWMFSPDERAAKVTTLLQEVEAPDQVEAEVARLLSEVAQIRAAPRPSAPGSGRVDGSAPSPAPRRARLKRAPARTSTPQDDHGR
jgi:uncharacterized membrane protein YhiD involved in acid resistance